MTELPRGTVTLVFTDIEGRLALLQELGERYDDVLEHHRRRRPRGGGRASGHRRRRPGRRVPARVRARRRRRRRGGGRSAGLRRSTRCACGWASTPGSRGWAARGTWAWTFIARPYLRCGTRRPGAAVAHGARPRRGRRPRSRRAPAQGPDPAAAALPAAGETLDSDFPSPRTLENRPTNLPVQPTPLIGRETSRAGDRADAPPGRAPADADRSGRPRQDAAGAAGRRRARRRVPRRRLLRRARGGRGRALDRADDRADAGGERDRRHLARRRATRYLGDRRLLLVLDNFEQMDAAAAAVASCSRAAKARVLVTSRACCGSPASTSTWSPRSGCPTPKRSHRGGRRSTTRCPLHRRVRGASPTFRSRRENARPSQICQRLDGLPLAIELAAARVRLLTRSAMRRKLGETGLALLTSGWTRPAHPPADTARRHRLEPQPARRRAAGASPRLSVFAGGWPRRPPRPSATRTSTSSKPCSRTAPPAGTTDGEARFAMLETIREYAAERLGRPVCRRCRPAHA